MVEEKKNQRTQKKFDGKSRHMGIQEEHSRVLAPKKISFLPACLVPEDLP